MTKSKPPTLHQVLKHYGWTTEKTGQYERRILDSQGEILFRGDAAATWKWLRAKKLYPIRLS